MLSIYEWSISFEIAFRRLSQDFTDRKSTLVQVMTAPSHYLGQCWPRSMSPNGVTKPQWVNSSQLGGGGGGGTLETKRAIDRQRAQTGSQRHAKSFSETTAISLQSLRSDTFVPVDCLDKTVNGRVWLVSNFQEQHYIIATDDLKNICHDDVIKWKHFPRCWPLARESTGHRWIPYTKASHAELWCFLWSALRRMVEQTLETPVIWDAIALVTNSL